MSRPIAVVVGTTQARDVKCGVCGRVFSDEGNKRTQKYCPGECAREARAKKKRESKKKRKERAALNGDNR